jgi:hypothetical protein
MEKTTRRPSEEDGAACVVDIDGDGGEGLTGNLKTGNRD